MKRLTLFLGGARSGKSDLAQSLARQRGGDRVLFVASGQPLDDEMKGRIDHHREARPEVWRTIEAPRNIAAALRTVPSEKVVLLDCVTLWVSNVLLADEARAVENMTSELEDLLAWHRAGESDLIVVSNEVGMGLVPSTELGRDFRDLLGYVNQRLAAAADDVYLLVAGLPIELKALTSRRRE